MAAMTRPKTSVDQVAHTALSILTEIRAEESAALPREPPSDFRQRVHGAVVDVLEAVRHAEQGGFSAPEGDLHPDNLKASMVALRALVPSPAAVFPPTPEITGVRLRRALAALEAAKDVLGSPPTGYWLDDLRAQLLPAIDPLAPALGLGPDPSSLEAWAKREPPPVRLVGLWQRMCWQGLHCIKDAQMRLVDAGPENEAAFFKALGEVAEDAVDLHDLSARMKRTEGGSLRDADRILASMTLGLAQGREVAARRIEACRHSGADTLKLSGLYLFDLPAQVGLLTHLRHIELYQNLLLDVPTCLSAAPNLHSIDLRANPLTFCHLHAPTLERLELPFPAKTGGIGSVSLSVPRLRALELGCLADNLEPIVEVDLKALTGLLEHFDLHQIERLRLFATRFPEPPPELARMTQLRVFHLHVEEPDDASIKRFVGMLPASLRELTLEFEGTGSRAIPPNLARLTNLTHLAMHSADLSGYRAPLFGLRLPQHLAQITLNGCGLREVPTALLNAVECTHLNLWSNNLTHLDGLRPQDRRLQVINLGRNSFSVFPEALTRLPDLTSLCFDKNAARPPADFPGLVQETPYKTYDDRHPIDSGLAEVDPEQL